MPAILDNTVLSSIFSPVYMRFETCCRLKSVSSLFDTYSNKYLMLLKEFDFLKILYKHRYDDESDEDDHVCKKFAQLLPF